MKIQALVKVEGMKLLDIPANPSEGKEAFQRVSVFYLQECEDESGEAFGREVKTLFADWSLQKVLPKDSSAYPLNCKFDIKTVAKKDKYGKIMETMYIVGGEVIADSKGSKAA